MADFQAWLKEQIKAAAQFKEAAETDRGRKSFAAREEAYRHVLDHLEDQPLYTEEQMRLGLLSGGALEEAEDQLSHPADMPSAERRDQVRCAVEAALDFFFTQQPAGVGADGQVQSFLGLSSRPDSEPRSADSDGNQQPLSQFCGTEHHGLCPGCGCPCHEQGGGDARAVGPANARRTRTCVAGGGSAQQGRSALESIQGDAYLWQIDNSPWETPEQVIEHLRKTAQDGLSKLDACLIQLPSGGQEGGIEEGADHEALREEILKICDGVGKVGSAYEAADYIWEKVSPTLSPPSSSPQRGKG